MTSIDELRILDVRIATALFGWNPPLTPHPTRPLARYATDWSLIPLLLEQCAKRDWNFSEWHDTPRLNPWLVKLGFSNGPGERWVRRGRADTLPLALCRAIVAVLDALEEVAEETKARES